MTLSIEAFREREDLEDDDAWEEWQREASLGNVECYALCETCTDPIEPDGECEHGCPSVLVELGVI